MEDLVAFEYMFLGEFAEGHLLGVEPNLHHLLLHHAQVEDELDEALHLCRQLALLEVTLLLTTLFVSICIFLLLFLLLLVV